MSGDYKLAKEAFVADNAGTSVWNVNYVSAVGLTSYYLYAACAQARTQPSLVLDFVTSIVPLLLGQTFFSGYPLVFNGCLIAIATAIWQVTSRKQAPVLGQPTEDDRLQSSRQTTPSKLKTRPDPVSSKPNLSPPGAQISRRRSPSPSTDTHAIKISSPSSPTFPSGPGAVEPEEKSEIPLTLGRFSPQSFLSVYRAQMMLMTVIAILAVDFPIFPRAFGKCEDWGTSLMDIGVGSFVFALGITNASEYLRNPNGFPLKFHWRVVKSFRKSIPVLILGAIRVIMVKGVEYPEHVTEYGVHWNFFFTLGLMPFVGTVLSPLRKGIRHRDQALIILIAHALSLKMGLQGWIMSSSRIGVLGMNKEGLVSLPGYIAIFLLGIDIGHYILPPDPYFAFPEKVEAKEEEEVPDYDSKGSEKKQIERRREELGMILTSYAIIWWSALGIISLLSGEVSRRLANPAYVLWTAAYNVSFLAGYLMIELYVFGAANERNRRVVPPLLAAYNKNGLLVFLTANLLTGLINLSIKTMYTNNGSAMAILGGYMTLLSGFAWLIRHKRFNI